MARQPRTPGATEAPKTTEVAAPTTAQQSDDVLNEILGAPKSKDAVVAAEPTGTAYEPEILLMGEPIDKDPQAKSEYEEFLEWRKNKAVPVTIAPVAPHVPASGVASEPVAKRTRQVCGPDGWTTEEY